MTTPRAHTTARVYLACLSCYNAGQLVGRWYDATDADHISIERVNHDDLFAPVRPDCEEMWCFDVDGLPLSRECSPQDAAAWGRLLEEIDEWQRPAVLAWVRSGDYVAEGRVDLPSLSDFEERYTGEWDDFDDYAADLFEDLGYAADMPDHLAPYFDMSAWARDLRFDYSTEPAPGGGVFVFRSL